MAKGSGLLLVGVGAAALAALALSSSTTTAAPAAPAAPAGTCTLDANITPAYATAVNQILALPVGAVPTATISALATQLQAAGFPLAAACLNARVAAAGSGGVMPGNIGGAVQSQPTSKVSQLFMMQHLAAIQSALQTPLTQFQQQAQNQPPPMTNQQLIQAQQQGQAMTDLTNTLIAAGQTPAAAQQIASNATALSTYMALVAGGQSPAQAVQWILSIPGY